MAEKVRKTEVITEMIARSTRLGRETVTDEGKTYGITPSDIKKLKTAILPEEIEGCTITLDEANLILIVTPIAQPEQVEDRPKAKKQISEGHKANIELGLRVVRHLQGIVSTTEDKVKLKDVAKALDLPWDQIMEATDVMITRKKLVRELLPDNLKQKVSTEAVVKTVPWVSLTSGGLYFEKEAPIPDDLLMWVGGMGYPMIQNFLDEVKTMGISKRVSHLPKNLVLGETKVFLAHDEGEIGDGVIFGYFTVDRVDMLVNNIEEVPEELRGQVNPVLLSSIRTEPERGSGWRNEAGAIYLMATESSFIEFENYVDYNKVIEETAYRFRSFKRVNGEDILNCTEYKTSPSTRIKQDIKLSEVAKGKRKQAWSDEERQALRDMLKAGQAQGKSNLWCYRQLAKVTNRSVLAINYQHIQMMKEEKGVAN